MSYNNSARFVFRKNGIYYFVRRVPRDLAVHYSAARISFSLRTRSIMIAAARANEHAERLDRYWYHLRASATEIPGHHLLRARRRAGDGVAVQPSRSRSSLTLCEATKLYKGSKGAKGPAFERTTDRAVGYLIIVCGDRPVFEITRKEANAYRDFLIGKGLVGSSISRMVSCVRAVLNCAASEAGVEAPKAFTSLQYDRHAGVTTRLPIPLPAIRSVQAACRATNDDLRWLIALISDTGLRLSEAAGLARKDVVIHDADGPYLIITPCPWRTLKTASGKRSVPLVGASLWAAKRAVCAVDGEGPLFRRYVKNGSLNSNSVSAATNKWLGRYVPDGCSIHGMRHAMRDRLRAVECPSDVVDQIGGWSTAGVGQGYGKGYPLLVLRKWMEMIT